MNVEAKLERLRSTHALIKKKLALYDRALEQKRVARTA